MDNYAINLAYLDSLLASERVLISRIKNPSGFFEITSILAELKRIQTEIAYLKETEPELFL